jgi:hypothetical protein
MSSLYLREMKRKLAATGERIVCTDGIGKIFRARPRNQQFSRSFHYLKLI